MGFCVTPTSNKILSELKPRDESILLPLPNMLSSEIPKLKPTPRSWL